MTSQIQTLSSNNGVWNPLLLKLKFYLCEWYFLDEEAARNPAGHLVSSPLSTLHLMTMRSLNVCVTTCLGWPGSIGFGRGGDGCGGIGQTISNQQERLHRGDYS